MNQPMMVCRGCADNVEQRLARLKRLHDEGLINDDEFQTKRTQLLNTL